MSAVARCRRCSQTAGEDHVTGGYVTIGSIVNHNEEAAGGELVKPLSLIHADDDDDDDGGGGGGDDVDDDNDSDGSGDNT